MHWNSQIVYLISSAMSTQDEFVAAAQKCLSVGRKCLSVPQSLDLAAQVTAVDLGLKPALLYDSNSAGSDQVQQYLSCVQSRRLLSESVSVLDLNENTVIINPNAVRSNVERAFCDSGAAVIDVRHFLERPTVVEHHTGAIKNMTRELLLLLKEFEQLQDGKLLYAGKKSEDWNLCTAFGLLLGYPVTYWFDQTSSFENCLAMTPLVVTTASALWQKETSGYRCCLYSFSVPAALLHETRPILDNWRCGLQERFQQQNILQDLIICQKTVTLPSVCL